MPESYSFLVFSLECADCYPQIWGYAQNIKQVPFNIWFHLSFEVCSNTYTETYWLNKF